MMNMPHGGLPCLLPLEGTCRRFLPSIISVCSCSFVFHFLLSFSSFLCVCCRVTALMLRMFDRSSGFFLAARQLDCVRLRCISGCCYIMRLFQPHIEPRPASSLCSRARPGSIRFFFMSAIDDALKSNLVACAMTQKGS